MHRRAFLQSSAAALTALALPIRSRATPPAQILFSAPLTHSDWILKPNIDPGPAGVRHMLDVCKAAGLSKIHWRVLDGGRAMYPSKILRPGDRWDPDSFWSPQSPANQALAARFTAGVPQSRKDEILAKFAALDYSKFDPFAHALDYGHSIGLQIHAWVTINEDDHGWGLISDFSRDHPQFRWVKRDGTPYHSQLSFAFPEVRDHKLSILKELLASYDLDGLFLDWIRTGDVRDNPQTDPEGIANSGYEAPNLDSFKSQYHVDPHTLPNSDPRWIATRALPQTLFMRSVKDLATKHNKPVSVLVAHPWHYRGFNDKIAGNLPGLLLDLPAWSREKLIDSAIPAGYYLPGGDMAKAYRALQSETAGALPIHAYAWVPTTVDQFNTDFQTAQSLGTSELLFWEADYFDDRPNRAELQKAMRAKTMHP